MATYINEQSDNDNDIIARMNSTKEKGFGHNLRKYLREYSEVTGIHGLRYVTEKRSRVEKIVWAFFLLISLGGCIYMIYEILYKYDNSPVVVSFATEDTPLYQIPFPAITICPEAKFKAEMFNFTSVYKKLSNDQNINNEELERFNHLSLVCDGPGALNEIEDAPKIVSERFFDTIDELKLGLDHIFLTCMINNNDINCKSEMKPIITDAGICYSFNIFDRQEIFKEHVHHYKTYYSVPNKSEGIFDIETGFKKNAGIHTYPRRALISGADNALTLIFKLYSNDTDILCNNFFQGFRVLIHNPWDVPRVDKHYFRVPFKKLSIAAIEPQMLTTSKSVRRFVPEKRKCYMTDERSLKYFKFYTQPNCLFECITNYTLQKCGCVAFYMPRDNLTAICGPGSSECLEDAEHELQVKELESQINSKQFCDCKPSCTTLKYSVETSHSDFHYKEFLKIENIEHLFEGFDISGLQVYFKDEQFLTMERNELYGTSDLISNLGGLLGLFTGFSLISLIEIIYFCSLRIFYNEKLYGLWSGPPKAD